MTRGPKLSLQTQGPPDPSAQRTIAEDDVARHVQIAGDVSQIPLACPVAGDQQGVAFPQCEVVGGQFRGDTVPHMVQDNAVCALVAVDDIPVEVSYDDGAGRPFHDVDEARRIAHCNRDRPKVGDLFANHRHQSLHHRFRPVITAGLHDVQELAEERRAKQSQAFVGDDFARHHRHGGACRLEQRPVDEEVLSQDDEKLRIDLARRDGDKKIGRVIIRSGDNARGIFDASLSQYGGVGAKTLNPMGVRGFMAARVDDADIEAAAPDRGDDLSAKPPVAADDPPTGWCWDARWQV